MKIFLLNQLFIFFFPSDYPTESEREFRRKVWAMRNPGKPLPKSDEAVAITKRMHTLEQYRADRKCLLQEKKKRAVHAAAVPVGVGEAEEENGDPIAACFPKQEVQEGVTNNHEEMGNDTVTEEGNDHWGEPYWFDKWHPREENPATVSDAAPYKYVETTDSMAELDLHVVDE